MMKITQNDEIFELAMSLLKQTSNLWNCFLIASTFSYDTKEIKLQHTAQLKGFDGQETDASLKKDKNNEAFPYTYKGW